MDDNLLDLLSQKGAYASGLLALPSEESKPTFAGLRLRAKDNFRFAPEELLELMVPSGHR